jgi:hypothetical protein
MVQITLGFAALDLLGGCNNFSLLKQNHYSSYSILVLEFFFVLILVHNGQSISFSFAFTKISLVSLFLVVKQMAVNKQQADGFIEIFLNYLMYFT